MLKSATSARWLLLVNPTKRLHSICSKVPQVPDLLRQNSCTADRATCHGTTLAFINMGHGHCHNGFPLDLDDHKNKRSRHRSFLYGCDRSPEVHVLKLGIEIPNLRQYNWSTKDLEILGSGVQLRMRKD